MCALYSCTMYTSIACSRRERRIHSFVFVVRESYIAKSTIFAMAFLVISVPVLLVLNVNRPPVGPGQSQRTLPGSQHCLDVATAAASATAAAAAAAAANRDCTAAEAADSTPVSSTTADNLNCYFSEERLSVKEKIVRNRQSNSQLNVQVN